jgi:HK97 family phage portal protein
VAIATRDREPVVARARRIVRTFFTLLPGPYTTAFLTGDDGLPSSVRVTESTALSIGAVYAALGIYADLVGTMPIKRYRKTGPDGVDEELPVPPFVEHPAGIPVGWTNEIGQAIWSLLLRGNAWARATSYDSTGYPASFEVWDPNRVELRVDANGRLRVKYYDLVLVDPSPLELLHVAWQAVPGSPFGVGVLDAHGPGGPLANAYAANLYSADVFRNPTPPSVLTHPMRLNAQQAADLQTQWADSIARSRAVPAVLSGGITFQPLTVNSRDVQLIESRRWNATEIATLFRLPPYLLGGSTGDSLTYATVEGENTRLWTSALQPMAVRLERAFGAWLPNGHRLRFVPDALLRTQTLDRFQAHKLAIDGGWETVDEVRALENRPPLTTAQKDELAPPPPPPPQLTPGGPADAGTD